MKQLTILIFILGISTAFSQTYKVFDECSFSVNLPTTFESVLVDSSPDYCDYETSIGSVKIIEFTSLNISRFEIDNISDLYARAVEGTKLNVSYKIQKSNWFIISGTNLDGNIVYWKRVVGDNFISDLYIEYNNSQRNIIEPYLGEISRSFKSL